MLNENKILKYRRFVEQLYLKCQEVQDENERHVYRIIKIKKMIKRRTKDVSILKNRLDRYNDGWRHVPIVIRSKKKDLKRGPKPKNKKDETKLKVRKKRKQIDDKNIIPSPETEVVSLAAAPPPATV